MIVVLVVLLGLGGWLLYSNNNSEPAPEETTNTAMENPFETANGNGENGEMELPNEHVFDTIAYGGNYESLLSWIDASTLGSTLSGPGPFTVFAPNDRAFGALPQGMYGSTAANPDELTRVLTYHVVPGRYSVADLAKMTSVDTVQGGTLTITVDPSGTVMVNGAKIVTPDLGSGNGYVHGIDAVLTPQ